MTLRLNWFPILIALLVFLGCQDTTEWPYRHVVLITMDTARADHFGCYGSDRIRTPSVDRLAAAATRFSAAVAAATTTLSSHTSIMTGTYPHTHGVVRNGFVVAGENEMLAEILRREGFYTAAFLGSFALSSLFDFDSGFEWYDEHFDIEFTPGRHDQNQRRAQQVTDEVLSFLDEKGLNETNLFLFVHYFDPHQPYDPPAPYDRLYTPAGGLKTSDLADIWSATGAHRLSVGDARQGRRTTLGLTRESLANVDGSASGRDEELAGLYGGEITYMDGQIGRLLDGLETRGILQNAIIVLTADHGETFWEHADFWNHGLWVYDTTVRVPLIIRLADRQGLGQVVDTPVSLVDVMPTILDLLGITTPRRVDGVSLVPLLRGESLDRGPVYSEANQPWRDVGDGQKWSNEANPRCVREGNLKYVLAPYLGDYEELYDLAVDPGERNNLISLQTSDYAHTKENLRKSLDMWLDEADPFSSEFNTEQAEAVRRRLESLGYIGGSGPRR